MQFSFSDLLVLEMKGTLTFNFQILANVNLELCNSFQILYSSTHI